MEPTAPRGGSTDGERVEARLTRLLNTGPFDEALRTAVAASGLSLDRIQDRLKRRGSRISVATLSSWQSGRYRPERPASLLVLAELEEVLGVPPKSLSALIGPPRPRGRRLAAVTDNRGLAAFSAGNMESALREVDTRWDEALTRLSTHARLELDARGRERGMYSRQLLRAEVDGPDRWITGFQREDPGPPPRLRVEPPHRLGKVVENPEIGLIVAEILFDRPLSRGDIIILEYTHENRTPRPYSTTMETALHVPVREYLMEVRFDTTALPESCYFYRTAELDADSRPQERLLKPDAIGSVLAVALSAGPCRLGIRWDWGDSAPLTVGP
ncbi:MAG TPA: helix-turn-helix transcriptional regulator [Actinospica sp.]|nr:helix-turn-helix transcriptional regulator [Actinospica sp.]